MPVAELHHDVALLQWIRAVVEQICTQLGVDFSALVDVAPERPAKDHAYLMDASKARVKLDWQPRITFAEGIRQTIEWVRKNLEEIRRLPLEYVHKP